MDETTERLAAERDRLTVREGETWRMYFRRMHTSGRCDCPMAYALCKYGAMWNQQHGEFEKGHGGWGWCTSYGWPTP